MNDRAPPPLETLRRRAKALNLHGLLAHWPDAGASPWVQELIQWEEEERARRSLERRLRAARIGRFKPLCDFDWNWPVKCDRAAVEDLMSLDFLGEAANAVLRGPNGIGKTMTRNAPKCAPRSAKAPSRKAWRADAGRLSGPIPCSAGTPFLAPAIHKVAAAARRRRQGCESTGEAGLSLMTSSTAAF